MFRKPKRKAKASLRRKEETGEVGNVAAAATNGDGSDSDGDDDLLLSEAKKRSKLASRGGVTAASSISEATLDNNKGSRGSVMHSYGAARDGAYTTGADLATRASEHHPDQQLRQRQNNEDDNDQDGGTKGGRGADGIFRDKLRNKFLAGPIRAQTNVRVTARFDYQPDSKYCTAVVVLGGHALAPADLLLFRNAFFIFPPLYSVCKDYKDTGFCGFGDTCIYLHDRGDTLTGWQLEQQWEEQQKQKKAKQEKEMQDFVAAHAAEGGGKATAGGIVTATDDGLPFACHLCREYFKDPVVTNCGHYFCEKCIMNHVRTVDEACPICGKDTSAVFNQPTKLISKKRQIVGSKATWEEYADAFTAGGERSKIETEEDNGW